MHGIQRPAWHPTRAAPSFRLKSPTPIVTKSRRGYRSGSWILAREPASDRWSRSCSLQSFKPTHAMTVSTARNYWTDARCAKAFWGQQELPAYRRLLADTLDWAAPAAGERWLDLGCGGGAITTAIWER